MKILQLKVKKYLLRIALFGISLLHRGVIVLKFIGILCYKSSLFIWKLFFRPIVISVYKIYLFSLHKMKTFFHAQHKLLAVLTHRFAIHLFVIILTFAVVFTNIAQAQTVRSEEFIEHSLVARIVQPQTEDIVIDADTITPEAVSYINTSAVIRNTASTAKGTKEKTKTNNETAKTITSHTGNATITQTAVMKEDQQSRNTVSEYTVQDGDTVSSIAAEFGISSNTIRWENDLADDLIKPGQKLRILPTNGLKYVIQNADSLQAIADTYKASVQDIVDYNHLLSASDITAGDELLIPNGVEPPPPPPPTPPTVQLASVRDTFSGRGSGASASAGRSSGTPPANAPVTGGAKMQWPTNTRRISQYYGFRHTGLDIDGNFGDPIWATDSGTVISAGSNGAYGLAVKIRHANGIVTHYAHLQAIYVSVGQQVGRGQTLGQEGSTGRSTGSHLHFECIVGGSFVNPYNCIQ